MPLAIGRLLVLHAYGPWSIWVIRQTNKCRFPSSWILKINSWVRICFLNLRKQFAWKASRRPLQYSRVSPVVVVVRWVLRKMTGDRNRFVFVNGSCESESRFSPQTSLSPPAATSASSTTFAASRTRCASRAAVASSAWPCRRQRNTRWRYWSATAACCYGSWRPPCLR